MRRARGATPGEPEFEPGSEGPVVPMAYPIVLLVVLGCGGTVMLFEAVSRGLGFPSLSRLAHDVWTWATPVCTCSIPFTSPGHRMPGWLERDLWALPVNLVAAVGLTALTRWVWRRWMGLYDLYGPVLPSFRGTLPARSSWFRGSR